jgi:undecaprenyl diphosphate synthase
VRLRVVGDLSAFDRPLQSLIRESEAATAGNSRLHLTICASYGGRWDLVQSVRSLIASAPDPRALAQSLSERQLADHLGLSFAPDPDLLIRTGGEQRISNFLLWQCAYSELYFTHTLWPDFDAAAFDAALAWFGTRERRFGQTSAQVAAPAAEELRA